MTTVTAPEAPHRAAVAAPTPGRIASFLADPRRALCAAVLALTAVVGLDALGDPDVWWHLRFGRWILDHGRIPTTELFSYTAAGHPLVPQEWLAGVIFAVLNGAGGLALVAVVMGAITWSGFVATALRGRMRGAGPVAIALGLVLGAKAAQPVLGTRPQMFTFALLCWTLWVVDSYLRRGGRRVWILPPVFLLWANLHAGFIAGIGVLGLIVIAEAVKRRFRAGELVQAERLRTLAVVAGVSAAVACINPSGPGLYWYALTSAPMERAKGIIEWQSPNFHDPGMWALLALLASFVALRALGARLDWRDATLAAVGAALALYSVRNTSLCVALVTPAWIAMAAQVGPTLGARFGVRAARVRVTRATVATGAAIVCAGVVAVGYTTTRVAADASPSGVAATYPACAVDVLSRAPGAQRVFAAYATGGFVIDRLWPRATVYEYGESYALGATTFAGYYRIASGTRAAPTALQLLEASHTSAVMYPAGALTTELDHTPGWTRVVDDHGTLLYVRGKASWASGSACAASHAASR